MINMPPAVLAALDQVHAAVRDNRADNATALAEQRCALPPMGCGQPIPSLATAFRDQRSRDEYETSRLCQACQDEAFAPDASELAWMAAHPDHHARCPVCGEFREIERVDIGGGVMEGFDCCNTIRFGDGAWPERCRRQAGCQFGSHLLHGWGMR